MKVIGRPLSRIEGPLKVTGGLHYTADIKVAGAAQGVIVSSTIANGRTMSIDTNEAERAPGVLAVFTHRNMPRMNPTPKPWSHLHPHGQSYLPLQDDQILYAGQPIALVVAATLNEATYAGTLIKVEYDSDPPVVFGPETLKEAVQPPRFLWPAEHLVWDREVGGSNPLAPTIHINNLRLPALAAVSLVWPICGQNSENALVSAVGRHECNASSSSDPYGPSVSLLLVPRIQPAIHIRISPGWTSNASVPSPTSPLSASAL